MVDTNPIRHRRLHLGVSTAADDDSAGSGDSRIQFIAPAAGTYCLYATSYRYGTVGPYTFVTSVW